MTELQLMRRIGNNIKDMLEDAWMSQKELAEAICVSESTISCYIKAERMPSIKNLINIAFVLDCELTDLVDVHDEIE